MTTAQDAPALDRPWRRPGAARYALTRIRTLLRPPVRISEPDPGSVVIDRDVPVVTRDGTVLRVNLHRPPGDGPFPVLLSAHPYGKDRLPQRRPDRLGGGYRVPLQFRMLRQTVPVHFSSLTGWEAPDPAWWTARGYAVVNADLRGAGTSEGVGSLLSDQEGEDVHDLVEWAGTQDWSTGAVGLIGVSYLAISQWKAAALHPPHLRAIVPWEGFTDAYRDLVRPGGIREIGFVKIWSRGLRSVRLRYSIDRESAGRPLRDEWWRSLVPDLAAITVPALICGSFSDNNLHSRGSFRGFEQISSAEKHVFTHRGGKWANFYSADALAVQQEFLDRHLGVPTGTSTPLPSPLPRVRLEVRESRDRVAEVRDETAWPLPSTNWTPLFLTGRGLSPQPPTDAGHLTFDTGSSGARIGWTVPTDTEMTGPMALTLFVSVGGATDVDLFVGVEKWCGKRYVPFEGSYGFGRDRVTTGWLKASLRALDPDRSRPFEPVPTFARREPLVAGRVAEVAVPLGPSSTLFRAGDRLRLVVAGRWLWRRNPLTGQLPAAYQRGPRGNCMLHWGPDRPARLLVPVIGA